MLIYVLEVFTISKLKTQYGDFMMLNLKKF